MTAQKAKMTRDRVRIASGFSGGGPRPTVFAEVMVGVSFVVSVLGPGGAVEDATPPSLSGMVKHSPFKERMLAWPWGNVKEAPVVPAVGVFSCRKLKKWLQRGDEALIQRLPLGGDLVSAASTSQLASSPGPFSEP